MRIDTGSSVHQTELGVLPIDWKIRSIRELQFDISDGNYSSKYPRADEFKSIGVPFIRANNIKGLTITDDDMRFISEAKHSEITKGHLKDGDVLITNRGEIGNLAIVPTRHIGSNINAQIVRINTSGSEVSNRYFAYYLQKDEVKKILDDLSSGSALKQLPVNRLTTLKVIIPSPQEQIAIANALSDVDVLIQELEKLIAKKQAIKTATMQQLLTGRTRLPQFAHHPDGHKKGYKPSELGEIPEDWEVKCLRQIIDNERGVRYGIVQPGKYDPNGRLMVRGQDYSKGWVNEHDIFRVSDSVEYRYRNARLKAGDLIITIVGAGTGHVEIVPSWLDGANLTQTTARMTINPNLANSKFVQAALLSKDGQARIASFIKGNAQPGLNCFDIYGFYFVSPRDISEQNAVAQIVSDMDKDIESLEIRLGKTRQIKQGMMQELLTGKTRLKS